MAAMQRHDFLNAPGREDARTERRRRRHGARYCGAGGPPLSASAWFFTCSAAEHDSVLPAAHREPLPAEQPSTPPSAKLLYHQAMQALERDWLQPPWGRIQQKGEMD